MNLKRIYKKIAKQHGITAEEVARDVQCAINETYSEPTLDVQGEKDAILTPAEFFLRMSKRAKA